MGFHNKGILFSLFFAILAGCEPATDGEASSPLLTNVNAVIEGSKATCKFIPTVASIAAIVGVPGAPVASELIDSICAEVGQIPSLESGRDAPRDVEFDLPEGTVDGVLLPN